MKPGPRSTCHGTALAVATVVLASCGVPRDATATAVEDAAVPYRLLEPAEPSSASSPEGPTPGREPSVFWLANDRLVPSPTEASCADDPLDATRRVLDALAEGPPDAERAAGRSTALPPESTLTIVRLVEGTAVIELESATSVSADRLPVVVGQVALTVASVPGVETVLLVSDGEPVPVPLPGGALTDAPVGLADYVVLVPEPQRRAAVGCST